MVVNINWIKENYFKYNNIVFDGKLPTDIKFNANKRLKVSCGRASYIVHLDTGVISDICLTISAMYDNSEDSHLCTLLHEMIHIEDYVFHPEHFLRKKMNGDGYEYIENYDAHGLWFLKECKRINSMNLIKFKLSPVQEAEETENEINVQELETRVCLLNSKTNDPSETWLFLKTNENGMKSQMNLVKSKMSYFQKNFIKIEWYKQSDDKVGTLSMYPTKSKFSDYLYGVSDSGKDKLINEYGLILVDKIELDNKFKRKKISDEKYISNLDWYLSWALKCITKNTNFKINGVASYNTTDEVSGIKLQISLDKKKDTIEILFNNRTPLYIGYKQYKRDVKQPIYVFRKTYGEMILNHLRNNGLIQEYKVTKFKTIIKEVIEEYLYNDSSEDYKNVIGKRQISKQIDKNTIIGMVE